jgi:hypothetical protein
LVNIGDPNGEFLGWPVDIGPVATFDIPVPPDISFAGLQLYTQAIHIGHVPPFALSNAQDLVLGF